MEYSIIYLVVAIIALVIVVKLLKWPLKILWKLIINGIIGYVLLYLVNLVGWKFFGFTIGINYITVLVAGFLGVPGVILLILLKIFL